MLTLITIILQIRDILKGEIKVGKIIKSNGGFDIPELETTQLPAVAKEIEKEEFTTRMKALSDEEMEWLMEVVPVEWCLKKIEREVAKVEEYKRAIKDISKAFD